jgi:septal ring factor EnvC (AmiA/AmiB activator)
MGDEQNSHGMSRLDRMEGLMQLLIDDHLKFNDEHKSLLTSQILLTDRMGKLVGTMETFAGELGELAVTIHQVAESQKELSVSQKELAGAQKELAGAQKELAEAQKELAEAQKHTDERMNALIAVVDDLIRRRPE